MADLHLCVDVKNDIHTDEKNQQQRQPKPYHFCIALTVFAMDPIHSRIVINCSFIYVYSSHTRQSCWASKFISREQKKLSSSNAWGKTTTRNSVDSRHNSSYVIQIETETEIENGNKNNSMAETAKMKMRMRIGEKIRMALTSHISRIRKFYMHTKCPVSYSFQFLFINSQINNSDGFVNILHSLISVGVVCAPNGLRNYLDKMACRAPKIVCES